MSLWVLNSCYDDKMAKTECNSDNPIEDFTWLKAIKITKTNCGWEISIRIFNSTVYRDFNDQVTRDKVLYRCKTTL